MHHAKCKRSVAIRLCLIFILSSFINVLLEIKVHYFSEGTIFALLILFALYVK